MLFVSSSSVLVVVVFVMLASVSDDDLFFPDSCVIHGFGLCGSGSSIPSFSLSMMEVFVGGGFKCLLK